jgi:hypothetical protein
VRCWCRRRGRCHPHDLLPDAIYGDEVISLSPVLLVCYVWLLQMVILFVSLQNVRNRLGWSENYGKNLGTQICKIVGNCGCMCMFAQHRISTCPKLTPFSSLQLLRGLYVVICSRSYFICDIIV